MIITDLQSIKNGIANTELSGVQVSKELKELIKKGLEEDGFIDTEKLIEYTLKKFKK